MLCAVRHRNIYLPLAVVAGVDGISPNSSLELVHDTVIAVLS